MSTDVADNERLAAWWVEYRTSGDRAARDALLVHYRPLVDKVAATLTWSLRGQVDRDDLAGYGVFGLIDAVDKFDPGREVRFETYAMGRIKGAIIDELRSFDWVPRSVRAKARKVEKAQADLEGRLGRTATASEVAAELRIAEEELDGILAAPSGMLALDAPSGPGSGARWADGDGQSWADLLVDRSDGPEGQLEVEAVKRVLASSIGRMGDRERLVLTLDYAVGLTLAEIGVVVGVSESRVTQIRTRALARLRSEMTDCFPL